jgi:hypothetical protein
MIRRLFLRWRFERALARRRAQREAYSRAARAGASTEIHNRFARDVLINGSRTA